MTNKILVTLMATKLYHIIAESEQRWTQRTSPTPQEDLSWRERKAEELIDFITEHLEKEGTTDGNTGT